MGASEQYCLKWNGFESNITSSFSDIRDDEDFLDVTLVTGGQTIRAHKLVLSACSPLFRSMLKKNTHPQPMIFIHGVRYADITAILNFMYHGEVNVSQEDLPTFLAAAEELRIRGLSDKNNLDGDLEPGEDSSSPRKRPRKQDLSASISQEESSNHSPRAKKANTSSGGSEGISISNNQPSTSTLGLPDETPLSEEDTNKDLIVTPDIAPEFHDDSNSVSEQGYSEFGFPYEPGTLNNSSINYSRRSGRLDDSLEGSSLPMSFWPPDHSAFQAAAAAAAYMEHHTGVVGLMTEGVGGSMGTRPHCPYCNKEMKNAHSLNVHISRYHNESSESSVEVICPVCERKYGNKYSLRTHMHLNHKDQLHLLGTTKKTRKSAPDSPQASSENNSRSSKNIDKIDNNEYLKRYLDQ
ncbi:protein abrupt-like isoform X1 [Tigriopus californicus]|nr:protein abrupt-like isoform X1 [Tigriopus californicus]|eukprot:TCALIF_05710-PA protein Name:"Similar to lolal Longitudinals lacking protein-like (Drosophila melanogaster)" AED:0.00 eAED:0.00 QI:1201/1/1/1/0/0/3/554/408